MIPSENNLNLAKDKIIEIAKELVPNYCFTPRLNEIFYDLLLYFTGNKGNLNLDKSIYIYGEFGVGKTITMQIFSIFLARYFPFSRFGFGNTSIETIAEHYKTNKSLSRFGRNSESVEINTGGRSFNKRKDNSIQLNINEFGKPIDEKYYGTGIQGVVNSMLMVRYELFQDTGLKTHATSNFHPEKLTCFDAALINRFKEMYNFIELDGVCFRV